jgi:hypothetical protein
MPKRTNTFQAVVLAIKQHLAGEAIVTESEELPDLISGEKREVDICIKVQIAGHPVIISLECRDHKRPQAVGWVEEMQSKHSRLPTDRLVLVSKSGFTPKALAKAESFGIETAVPEDLTETRIGEIVQGARARLTKLDLQIERVRVWVTNPDTGEEEVVVTIPGNTVFSDLRVPIGSMLEIMEAAKPYIMPEFGKLMINAADDTNKFEVVINDPTEIAVGSPPTNQAWYLEKIEPTPHLRRVDRVEITGAAKIIKTPIVPLREGKLQNASYSWAETSFDGSKTVIVRTKTAEDKITIRSL